jgi:predicted DNA repair protein MutK
VVAAFELAAPELTAEELVELEKLEKKKIAGAIKTDFVLSTEIIVIALGSLPADISLALRATLLVVVGLAMTVGVYGVVALIVKLDDIGYWLAGEKNRAKFWRALGGSLIVAAPALMKLLSVVGTLAMFLVGGGILAHGFPFLSRLAESWGLWPPLFNGLFGLLAGFVLHPALLGLETLAGKIKKSLKSAS